MTRDSDKTILQSIEQGFRLHQAGQLEQAEKIYRRVLQQDPNNAHVLNFLGIIAYQTRRYEEAERLARRAVRANAKVANFHNTLGLAIMERGDFDHAEVSFRQALLLEPSFLEAQSNLGNVLRLAGKFTEATAAYQTAIVLSPSFVDAHCGLGKVYADEKKQAQARACFERALALEPGHADARNSLGLLLHEQSEFAEAEALFRSAIEQRPNFIEAHNNLGNVLRSQGKLDAATISYQRALALAPDHPDVCFNLANLLDETGNLDQAIALYKRALSANPTSMKIYRHLAGALATQGKPEDALAIFRRAFSLGATDGLRVQAAALLPVIPASVEDISRWRTRFETELDRLYERPLRLQDPMEEVTGTNFFLGYHGLNNRRLHMKVAKLYEKACPSLLWTAPHCLEPRPPSNKIRVGFISRFMFNHSVGRTTRGLLANLARDQFEIVALFVPPITEDETSSFIRANSTRSVVLPATLPAARQAIADLQLDVLFYQDIGMERFTYFLAFARLAAVQCASFGHPDTTGIASMDYFVSSDLFETAEAKEHYSESLFLLHDLGNLAYYYRPTFPGATKRREDFGLPIDANLYLCPQTLFKFHPEFDKMLGEVLRRDPRGRLVLLAGKVPHWLALLRARFHKTFPDVVDRLIVLPNQTRADFMDLIAVSDVMLDPIHFNGMNTSLEGFAVGIPIVTMPTALQRGRHTAGMYKKMGIPDAIADTPEAYVEIAVGLGSDSRRRDHLKDRILQRNAVLFEDIRVVREFERFFVTAVERARR